MVGVCLYECVGVWVVGMSMVVTVCVCACM